MQNSKNSKQQAPNAKKNIGNISNLSAAVCSKCLIETFFEEFKPLNVEKYQFKYRNKSNLRALFVNFELSEFWWNDVTWKFLNTFHKGKVFKWDLDERKQFYRDRD